VAQEEQDCIRNRQRESSDPALNNSIWPGLPKAQVSEKFMEAYTRWKPKRNYSCASLGRSNLKVRGNSSK